MSEIWRDIQGFEGVYQVSNHGRVRNILFFNGGRCKKYCVCKKEIRVLKPQLKRMGYMVVHLSKGKKDYYPMVHRLVANAFIPNPDNLPQVNHKDENKTNNDVSNLEWCSCKYNLEYGTGQKRAHDAHKKPILQLNKETGIVIKRWDSATDAATTIRNNKKCKEAITACARGEKRSAYGYKWIFESGRENDGKEINDSLQQGRCLEDK